MGGVLWDRNGRWDRFSSRDRGRFGFRSRFSSRDRGRFGFRSRFGSRFRSRSRFRLRLRSLRPVVFARSHPRL